MADEPDREQGEPAAEEGQGPDPKPVAKRTPRVGKKPAAEVDDEPAAEVESKRLARKAPSSKAPAAARRTSRAKPAASRTEAPAETAAPAAGANGAAPARAVVRAQAKYVRTSARKARMVCDQIRGKTVEDAFAILAHTPRAVAEDWRKLLQSAVANAEHNHELVGDDLRIASVNADEGPTLKRFRPRAMGRATQIRKRTSHLTITLTPKDPR